MDASVAQRTELPALLAALETSEAGLSVSEAQRRRVVTGANEIAPQRRHSALRLLARQYASPLTLVLVGATVVSMLVGELVNGLIIIAIIIPTGALGFWQEHAAGRLMDALNQRLQPTAVVRRDGSTVTIAARDVVPGDVLELSVGAVVAADARVIACVGLEVDESTLTGESMPQAKAAATDDVRMGTHVAAGTATAVVYATGRDTAYGAMARDLEAPTRATSFERGSTDFGMLVVRYIALLLAAVFVVNVALHRPVVDSLLFSLALAVGLTPQLLPVIVTVTLSAGARRLAAASVLVKRLDAIEDFGSMSVLCCDKTGTLTAGAVSVERAVDWTGAPSERVLRLAAVNARLQSGYSNAIDAAVAAAVPGDIGATLLDEAPYDFTRKRLTVLAALAEAPAAPTVVTKGAVRSVIDVCTAVRDGSAVVPIAEAADAITRLWDQLSKDGLRVLAVATGQLAAASVSAADEHDLVLEGLVAFADPIKEDAPRALDSLRGLGIEAVLVTGDNPLVAAAVAARTGFDTTLVVTGPQVAAMSDDDLAQRARNCRVFAEIEPLQKERIVRAFQAAGHSVGLLGDGVNDSAALRVADVGISVDTAAQVAKETAAIVLLRKDLGVIVDGVIIGRRTFANTIKYIRITISANFGNVLSMALASAFLPYLPLLAAQVLLLNFLSDIPALTVAGDRVDPEDVAVARSWNLHDTRRFMITFGLVSTVFDLTAFTVLRAGLHADAATFHSAWFVESTLTELVALLALRTTRPFWRSRPSAWMALASAGVASLTLALPFTPAARALGLTALSPQVVWFMVTITAAYVLANELAKAVRRRRSPQSSVSS